MQGLVGEACSFRGVRHHSSLTCIEKDNTEVKKVLLSKRATVKAKSGPAWLTAAQAVRFGPRLALDLEKALRGEIKTAFILSKPYQDLFCKIF